MINWWRTELGHSECKNAFNAIKKKYLSSGPLVEDLEKKFSKLLNVKYSVACPSGSMSIVMALLAHGIKPGDEVIVPCSSWISTAHAPMLLGAKVKLVDVLKDNPVINHNEIEKKISSKTKAIIPVHLNGHAANIKEIKKIASKYNIKVIEDSCQAMISRNKFGFLGTQSDAGCFSFGVTKLITTGQGGIVVTNKKNIYKKLLKIRNNGMNSILSPKYECFGLNFKFSDILASVGIAQLKIIGKNVKSLKELYKIYDKSLENIASVNLIKVDYLNGELPLYVEILTENRKELMEYLKKYGILTRKLPPALSTSPHLKQKGDFRNSIAFGEKGMYLPSGPNQRRSDIDKVISCLKKFDKYITKT